MKINYDIRNERERCATLVWDVRQYLHLVLNDCPESDKPGLLRVNLMLIGLEKEIREGKRKKPQHVAEASPSSL